MYPLTELCFRSVEGNVVRGCENSVGIFLLDELDAFIILSFLIAEIKIKPPPSSEQYFARN